MRGVSRARGSFTQASSELFLPLHRWVAINQRLNSPLRSKASILRQENRSDDSYPWSRHEC